MPDTAALVVPADRLRAAAATLLRGCGSADAEADEVAANLVDANLTGHDSHGVGMLPRYVDAVREGGLVPNTAARTVLDTGVLLRLDGGTGFGQVVGRQAMDLGIARAQRHGCCIVAVGNAHHLGRIGAWAEQAAAAGLVSVHLVNVVARPIVAAHGAARAGFGTNPFAAGVPMAGREPLIVDFATSRIAQGKTRVAFNKGEPVPEGHLIDDHGRPTTDPRWTVQPPWGALLTLGEHKGYGLAVLAELLGGALAASRTGQDDDGSKQRILNGMLSILIDPAALGDAAGFEAQAAAFADSLLATPAREGFDAVQLPGDVERATRARRSADGVPVDPATWAQIEAAGGRIGVPVASLRAAAGLPA